MKWQKLLARVSNPFFLIGSGVLLMGLGGLCRGPLLRRLIDNYLMVGPSIEAEKAYYLSWAWLSLLVFGALLTGVGILGRLLGGHREVSEDSRPTQYNATDLVLVSVLILFVESLLIRWVGQEIKVISYFKNISLISCFIGLGIGCLLAHRKPRLLNAFPFILAFIGFLGFSALGKIIGMLHTPLSDGEFLWSFSSPPNLFYTILFYTGLPAFFILQAMLLAALGQRLGELFPEEAPLRAYSLNILGSLLGVLLFWVISAFYLPAWSWFLVAFLLIFWLMRKEIKAIRWTSITLGLGTVLFGAVMEWGVFWSPYYRLDVYPMYLETLADNDLMMARYAWDQQKPQTLVGYGVAQNLSSFSLGFDYSDETFKRHAPLADRYYRTEKERYDYPTRTMRPKKVLVIGIGLGCDIAAALRQGAEHVDAVEIDPMVGYIARKFNPERPFDNPKVHLTIQDGRAFLKDKVGVYDQIIFSAIDSQTLLSGMSSIRLDNFIYTYESFQAARRALNDHGALFVYFASSNRRFVWQRIQSAVSLAFQGETVWSNNENMVMAGPGLTNIKPLPLPDRYPPVRVQTPEELNQPITVRLPTDDWPYLYLKTNSIPSAYFIVLGILMIAFLQLMPLQKSQWDSNHLQFLFLGAGFLLLETKAVTELSLLFGATWTVNSAVFTIVLIMILIGNAICERFPKLPINAAYVLLLASLGAQLKIGPAHFYAISQPLMRAGAITVFYGIPFLMAALIFGTTFKRQDRRISNVLLGVNLMGSMLGGMLEYSSLVFGIRYLALIAGGLYALAWIFAKLSRRHMAVTPI